MITHEFISGKSKTGYPQQTFRIIANNLIKSDLETVIRYMTDHIYIIYDRNKEIDGDVMWPIEIKMSDNLILSESSFWKHAFDSLSGAYEHFTGYIDRLISLADKNQWQTLLQSNEYHFHGGVAFNQFWLWCIENPFPNRTAAINVIYRFNTWLSKNDLEFEVAQDDCINLIFTHYRLYDCDAIAILLAIRLNDGQVTEKGFDYLINLLVHINNDKKKGLLKRVIDNLLDESIHTNGAHDNEAVFYELCAIIYGSNVQATKTVMDYVQSKINKKLWPMHDHAKKRVAYFRQVGDLYWQQVTSRNRYIDTSFHLFDTHTRKWIDYDQRE